MDLCAVCAAFGIAIKEYQDTPSGKNRFYSHKLFTTPLMRVCLRASYDVSGGIRGLRKKGVRGVGKRGGVLRISRLSGELRPPPKCVQVVQLCRTDSHK